jgi:hypothetical protein
MASSTPTEILYVLVGKVKTEAPSVAAFNGEDDSSDPKPLYTIRPNGLGSYDYLAADSADNLFVAKGLANSTKIYMFGPGKNKADAVCILPFKVANMTIASDTLYLSVDDGSDRIEELPEPFAHGTCAQAKKTVVDETALREGGTILFGVAVDPSGAIFDIYEGGPGMEKMYMDEFSAGTDHSHAFYNLGESYSSFYIAIDSHKNLITNLQNAASDSSDYLAVFPKETKKPNLVDPLDDGAWQDLAFAKNDTELFAISDYPTTKVSVFDYDPATGTIGKVKRAIGGLWPYDQVLAVYSKT